MLSLTMHKFFKAFFSSLQSVFNSHTHGSKTEGKPRKIWQDILVIFLFVHIGTERHVPHFLFMFYVDRRFFFVLNIKFLIIFKYCFCLYDSRELG